MVSLQQTYHGPTGLKFPKEQQEVWRISMNAVQENLSMEISNPQTY